MQFTAGALLCAAVVKLQPSERARRLAGYGAVLLAATIVASLYLLDAHPLPKIPDSNGLVDVLFVPLVLTLAVGAGTLPGLLSIGPMVYLGRISFSLYMVHELVHTTWNWMVDQFELRLLADLNGKLTLLAIIGVAFAGAVLLYHLVEEPARRWMRSMMKDNERARRDSAPGKLAPIHVQREERAKTVSARAV